LLRTNVRSIAVNQAQEEDETENGNEGESATEKTCSERQAMYLYHPRTQLQLRVAHGYSEKYRFPLVLSGSLGLRGQLLTVPHRDIFPSLGTSLVF